MLLVFFLIVYTLDGRSKKQTIVWKNEDRWENAAVKYMAYLKNKSQVLRRRRFIVNFGYTVQPTYKYITCLVLA